jgi:hypothetical protein
MRDISVVVIENVLHCNIFIIACGLPKNDNSTIPAALSE